MKPAILLSGNCQAEFFVALLKSYQALVDKFDVVYVRGYPKGGEIEPPPPLNDDTERCVLLLEQTGDFDRFHIRDRVSKNAEFRRYPVAAFGAIFPFCTVDPRNKPTPEHPYGPFPIGDRIGMQILSEGFTGDAAVAQYYRRSLEALAKIQRLREIESARIERVDQGADVRISDFVNEQLTKQQLFHHWQHPTSVVLGHVLDRTFKATDLLKPFLQDSSYSALINPLLKGQFDPFSSDQLPVHPAVAIGLDLRWCSAGKTFRTEVFGDEQVNFDQFIRAYLSWTAW